MTEAHLPLEQGPAHELAEWEKAAADVLRKSRRLTDSDADSDVWDELTRTTLDGIKISPLANPAMPMPIPMPVMVQMLPGMESMATMMMKNKMKSKGVASLKELRDLCLEAEVKFIACQMTVDLFEFQPSEFIKDVEFGGAATFMKFAGESDVCLFI